MPLVSHVCFLAATASAFLVCILCPLVAHAGLTTTLHVSTQRAFMNAFFVATNGAQWTSVCAFGWVNDSLHECLWFGVACDGPDGITGNITSLNLASCGLSGTLPDSFQQLPQLATLDVSDNTIGGTLPHSLSALQDTLSQIYFFDNHFVGTLPGVWSLASNLTTVQVMNNSITGTLPASWAQMSQLNTLWLSQNSLTGTLPSSWANMQQLMYLDVSHNSLVGTIPASYSEMFYMAAISLNNNHLTGELPASLANWTNIQAVALDFNHFTGTLPNAWGVSCPNLSLFTAAMNNISGQLPSSWGNLTFLSMVNISGNLLTGPLPDSWNGLVGVSFELCDVRWNCLSIAGVSNSSWWSHQLYSPQRLVC